MTARRVPLAAAALVTALLTGAACTSGAGPGRDAATPATSPSRSVQAQRPPLCLGYHGLNRWNPVARVMNGTVRLVGHPAVRFIRHGKVNWNADPYADPSWRLWFASLQWTGALLDAYGRHNDPALLRRVTTIAQSYVRTHRDDPADPILAQALKFRLGLLTCLRAYTSGKWLDDAIAKHAAFLARKENYSGPWNHGTDESLALLVSECHGMRRSLATVGYKRLTDAILHPPPGVRPAIDKRGANSEQSTGYALYNRSVWNRVAGIMRLCGYRVPLPLAVRLTKLDAFLAYQINPDGTSVDIGQSGTAPVPEASDLPAGSPLRFAVSGGTSGSRPAPDAVIYRGAGYLMGRTTWGEDGRPVADAAAYTARFGPHRYAHGHNDHLALTYYAQRHPVLVTPGFYGYSSPQWEARLAAPEAQNTVALPGVRPDAGGLANLVTYHFTAASDSFVLADDPAKPTYPGTVRRRSVLVLGRPDVMLVVDHVTSPSARTVAQRWHLAPGVHATRAGRTVGATAGGWHAEITSLNVPGTTTPARVTLGTGPVVRKERHPVSAPVAEVAATGTDVRLLTVITAHRDAPPPHLTATRTGGTIHLRGRVSGRTFTATISPTGILRAE